MSVPTVTLEPAADDWYDLVERLVCSLSLRFAVRVAEIEASIKVMALHRTDEGVIQRMLASLVAEDATEFDVNQVCGLILLAGRTHASSEE